MYSCGSSFHMYCFTLFYLYSGSGKTEAQMFIFSIGGTNGATPCLSFLEVVCDSHCFLTPFFALPTLVLALSREGRLL